MTELRRLEKADGGQTRYWEIQRDGVRCTIGWGRVGGAGRASVTTLDDEAHARRHVERKAREKLRQGYAEVVVAPDDRLIAGPAPDAADESAHLFDVMREEEEKRRLGAWADKWARLALLDGYDDVYVSRHPGGPKAFRSYLMLADEGRRGLTFVVQESGHDPAALDTFLRAVGAHRELAFDGGSHHKIALTARVGRFTHLVVGAPSLNSMLTGGRLGRAFPVFACEIGDADTEALVDARIRGRGSLPTSSWEREPHPVIDLRWDITNRRGEPIGNGGPSVRERTFKVYTRRHLQNLPTLLADATDDSFLDVRDARGEVARVTPATYTPDTVAGLEGFVLGGPVP